MADAVDVVRCLFCSTGMAANLLIVSIVARYPAMRTACNVYVANLAVADFSFCLLALIQSIIAIQSTNSEALYLQLLEDFCSNVWNEMNFTVTTRNVTNHTGSYMIGENCTGQLERVTIFDAYCFEDELNSTSTTRNDFLFGYVLPSCIIIPLYARILLKVRQSSRLTVRETRSDHQAFLMVFVVTVVFLINWLPFHIISLLIHMFVAREKYDTIGVALSFAVLNSVANPFLYALLGRNFRDKVKKMLCCKQWWWKSKRWIPKGEASPETTLTIHAIDTTGYDNDQSLATGGAKEGHATGGTGQARATWTMQAQATDRTEQTQAKGGTGQVQATDETEQAQPADRTEQGQATGGTGQTQATGGAGQAQASGGAGQAHTTGGTEQAQASGGAGQAQSTDRTGQPQSTGGTEQARTTGGTEQAQATGGTGQVQPTDRKEQA
uniref:G-protein coupled receptors family 1 profile domain-containing protein n=1 Tax=Branchiostoma floridae TaxID=7739 RepID=C3ZGB0_BRAFL|eukprot:XP_002592420.1 hypothetical protein BRAFLDRAFT_67286 [Branchiostoma floridae]